MHHLFVPFGDLTNGAEPIPAADTSSSSARRRGSTTSTSTAPFIRSATTTRRTTARIRRAKTACRCRSAPARRWDRRDTSETSAISLQQSAIRHHFSFDSSCQSPVTSCAVNASPHVELQATSMISAIVFDFDGVLADSEPLHLRAYQEVLAGLGVTLRREEYYAPISDTTMRGCSRRWPKRTAGIGRRRSSRALIDGKDGSSTRSSSEPMCSIPARRRASNGWPSIRSASRPARCGPRSRPSSARALDRHFRFIVASGDTPGASPRRTRTVAPPSFTACLRPSAWRSKTRAGASNRRRRRAFVRGITNTYPRSELVLADRVIDSLAEFTPALIRSL